MLYLIGLGLNEKSYSRGVYDIINKCRKNGKIYLESYTSDFPYPIKELEKQFNKKIIKLNRQDIESDFLINDAKKQDVVLLVYGSPLFATTHISLIQDLKKAKINYKIIYNASVFDAIAETGLQLYKFGKITSLPNFKADSYIDIIKQNQSINAHSLILIDIGMGINQALDKLLKDSKKNNLKFNKIIICSQLGANNSKIYYENIKKLYNKKIKKPYCIIIPSKLHFLEEEVLETF